ncbi:MAG: hypothetical protein WC565_08165 [Parcubacteria group bacterium]
MALEVSTQETAAVQAKVRHTVGGNLTLEEGRKIILRLTSPQEDQVELKVPNGETWRVQVAITIDVE